MPKYEVEVEISERKKVIVDVEDACEIRNYLDINFPEWASDNESEYILYSLGYDIIGVKKIGE